MKIRMVLLVLDTLKNLTNFACPDSGKMAFSVFSGYFNKVVLINVKVAFFGQIWSLTLFSYANENNDGLVSI